MPRKERARDWLALILASGLGPRRLASLETELEALADWSSLSDTQLRALGLEAPQIRALRAPDPERLDAALDWLEDPEHHLLTRDDELFPPLLNRIPDPPIALFVVGEPSALIAPQLAIVGSRNATAGGLHHARDFAATIARAGFTITSGLAAGVDAAAHGGCLDAGGVTVAVTGTGPDRVYPASNRDLARRIVDEGGVIVTPFAPGTPVRSGNFPARNRIISGMSLGTLVVEAGLRSGSLITARLAGEQGRDVFAIPGSVHNPLARGCHRLIRDGARLVETADEVIEELAPLAGELAARIRERLAAADGGSIDKGAHTPHVEMDPEHERVLEAVGYDPTPVDEIIRRSQLTTAAVSSILLIMELDGRVDAHPGGRYSRTGHRPADKEQE
ncbi:DNA-processing protein DprA [Wenzhouxiangella marina]|uniref:Smf protein n=1 Tax=Wenzhouxiangella marina TaxID=1579979 RepID=A0A0K0XSN1_9GAMM|nr:DNA-processing protein DprA [Wenzhouxiangella marina]AKS40699.1 Smf protein [Wenzhouxiangella marina]MBB6088470.1 DNA processing protein [Wenzhouxiangella marina]